MFGLLSIVNEIVASRKEEILTGTFHNIYFSKKHPDRLFKVGGERTVLGWSDIFKKHPKYFPKIYRIGKMQRGDKLYVEIEKLDTKRVVDEWASIDDDLILLGIIDENKHETIDMLFRNHIKYNDEMGRKLKAYNEDQYNLLIKWLMFIQDVTHILKINEFPGFDIHRYNFGYDSMGNMKCLDI